MMRAFHRILGLALLAVALVAMREVSLWPVGRTSEQAALRLTWSARPERVERCRTLSDEELAALPTHMRMRTQCEGRFARYLLRVAIDGRAALADTLHGGGLREDRPIYYLRDLPVAPGTRTVAIVLQRIDSAGPTRDTASTSGDLGDRLGREAAERRRRAAEALPAALVLDTTFAFAARQVIMVTYLNEERRLSPAAPVR